MRFPIFTYACLMGLLLGCNERIEPEILPDEEVPEKPSEPSTDPDDQTPSWPEGETGKTYVWDKEHIPQIKVYVSKNQWKTVLDGYDEHSNGSSYVRCSVVFDKDGAKDSISNAAIRLRDNSDAMRPNDSANEMYVNNVSDWNLSNYEINFNKYISDEKNSLRKVKGIFLKSCYNDPTYSRERYCYDLFDRFGIWTISRNTYCRLSFHIEGDKNPAYLGVYQMIEPIDNDYLEDRSNHFGNIAGNLWKCHFGATLSSTSNLKASIDKEDGTASQYMLVTGNSSIADAAAQLKSFITNLTTLPDDEFKDWISKVCDVQFLLKTYAVNVTVGMWDDYWNNSNNYYLYFDSTSTDSYKVYLIPHDYEMSLGNSSSKMQDPSATDPFKWGQNRNPLIARILAIEEFKDIYADFIMGLLQQGNYLFYHYEAINTIKDLMQQVEPYTANDTGINMHPVDKTHPRSADKTSVLTTDGRNCFFYKRSNALNEYIAK